MDIINNIVNTCELTRGDSGTIAYYSHLIPVVLSLFLAIFVMIKAKFNLFSKVFFANKKLYFCARMHYITFFNELPRF